MAGTTKRAAHPLRTDAPPPSRFRKGNDQNAYSRNHSKRTGAGAAVMKIRCCIDGCPNRATYRTSICYDHDLKSYEGPSISPARTEPLVYSWDVVCLLCADRRIARGTEEQARVTMANLPACAHCRGPLIVESAEVGAISSPSAVHSATYQSGIHVYRVSPLPREAA